MTGFRDGFINGVKVTPRAFFAPAVALWRLLQETTDDLIAGSNETRRIK